jgi:hypothetical protein
MLGELLICLVISCSISLPACRGGSNSSAVLLRGCLPVLPAARELELLVLNHLVVEGWLLAGADAACTAALSPPPAVLTLALLTVKRCTPHACTRRDLAVS